MWWPVMRQRQAENPPIAEEGKIRKTYCTVVSLFPLVLE
jgi:hypothetical protein